VLARFPHLKEKLIAMIQLERLRELLIRQPEQRVAQVGLRELTRTFLRLGTTGFGGGIAVIAQIRRIVVSERQWLNEEEFLDAVSLAQSLPGANTANATTYIGLKLSGIRGAIVSVVSFLFPSFLMVIGLAIAHTHLRHFPDFQRVFQGLNAAVVGLIAATAVRLGQSAMPRQWHLELGVATAFVLIFMNASVAEVVLLAGMLGIFIRSFKVRARHLTQQRLRKFRQAGARTATATQEARRQAAEAIAHTDSLATDHAVNVALPTAANDAELRPVEAERKGPGPSQQRREAETRIQDAKSTTHLHALTMPVFLIPVFLTLVALWQLIMVFLRVGSVTFGGGFVMIPQIETDVVRVHQWMTQQEFADGVVFGQITPGPVLITATFIGYKVAGLVGAVAATAAAFLPSFLMTILAGMSLNRFRTNQQVQAFLAGVAPAVVGMLTAAAVSLARSGLHSTLSFGVATLAFLLMLRAKLNPVIIIFGCGLLQFVISRFVLRGLVF
jgi:chromate transporter